MKQFFDVFITSDQIEKGKPNPDMIYKACEQLNVNPKNVVLIGDTDNDIKAGHAAGCKTIGIQTEADYEINDIYELLNIVKR
jgi:phosphoglycolate phosphatase